MTFWRECDPTVEVHLFGVSDLRNYILIFPFRLYPRGQSWRTHFEVNTENYVDLGSS